MLDMKKACEQCQVNLEPDGEAYICSYECTFCAECTQDMTARCPNCGAELLRRPRRDVAPSTTRQTTGA